MKCNYSRRKVNTSIQCFDLQHHSEIHQRCLAAPRELLQEENQRKLHTSTKDFCEKEKMKRKYKADELPISKKTNIHL